MKFVTLSFTSGLKDDCLDAELLEKISFSLKD
jgi:hypothetical protein